jgi:succinate dehydrogenase / fumarate reductase cytochrome b subunit
MAEAKFPARPMSPHLQIYRVTWTMAMSVFHRGTGVALYFGTGLLAIWLLCLASGPVAYDRASWAFGSIPGKLVMFGYTWALLHHMLGGVRHLVWDTGVGFEPGTRMQLARFTLIGSVTLTVAIWVIAYLMR